MAFTLVLLFVLLISVEQIEYINYFSILGTFVARIKFADRNLHVFTNIKVQQEEHIWCNFNLLFDICLSIRLDIKLQ